MDDKSMAGAGEVEPAWLDDGSVGTADTLYGSKGMTTQPAVSAPAEDWLYMPGGFAPPEGVTAVHGTNGDDVLHSSAADEKLYGGKGRDTVVYQGNFSDYELRFRPEGWDYVLVDKVSGRDGTDLLNMNDIDRLQFADQAVLLPGWGGATLEDGTPLLLPLSPEDLVLPEGAEPVRPPEAGAAGGEQEAQAALEPELAGITDPFGAAFADL